jgi:uncharacterized UBP type Zn finger protein
MDYSTGVSAESSITFNPEAMALLEGMGFPAVRCQKALLATGNNDPNVAMEWLFMHMEDPGQEFIRGVYDDNVDKEVSCQTSILPFSLRT